MTVSTVHIYQPYDYVTRATAYMHGEAGWVFNFCRSNTIAPKLKSGQIRSL